jgi:hypothetical protein
MGEFKNYQIKGLSEMRPYVKGEDLFGISVSMEDNPEIDMGMIARNPKNHKDQWYVARKYFEENLELVQDKKSESFINDGTETQEETVNKFIKSSSSAKVIDTNMLSDGYHTFGELYEHRIVLFMILCRTFSLQHKEDHEVWMTKTHSDGSVWDGWFVLGILRAPGAQMTYHLPMEKWDECSEFAVVRDMAPEFDGHTSDDVLKRVKSLFEQY